MTRCQTSAHWCRHFCSAPQKRSRQRRRMLQNNQWKLRLQGLIEQLMPVQLIPK